MSTLKKFLNSKFQIPKNWSLRFWAWSFSTGFTFIEVLVTIAIISLVTSGSYVSIKKNLNRAHDNQRKEDIKVLAQALEQYYNDNFEYPPPASYPETEYASDGSTDWIPGLRPYMSSYPDDPKQVSHALNRLLSFISNKINNKQKTPQVAGLFTPQTITIDPTANSQVDWTVRYPSIGPQNGTYDRVDDIEAASNGDTDYIQEGGTSALNAFFAHNANDTYGVDWTTQHITGITLNAWAKIITGGAPATLGLYEDNITKNLTLNGEANYEKLSTTIYAPTNNPEGYFEPPLVFGVKYTPSKTIRVSKINMDVTYEPIPPQDSFQGFTGSTIETIYYPVQKGGQREVQPNVFEIFGSGRFDSGTGHYVHKTTTGDSVVVAKLESLTGVHDILPDGSAAAIRFSDSISHDTDWVSIGYKKGYGIFVSQSSYVGPSWDINTYSCNSSLTPPLWFKIERIKNPSYNYDYKPYWSSDGVNYNSCLSFRFVFTDLSDVNVGFWVNSNNTTSTQPNEIADGIISNFTIAPYPTPAPTPTPTPTPTPPPGSPACQNKTFVYCYMTNISRSTYTLWAQLENTNDSEINTNASAKCQLATPNSTTFNYCIQSPVN